MRADRAAKDDQLRIDDGTHRGHRLDLRGGSPPDFAPEDYETGYAGRATVADLTEVGRDQFGLSSDGMTPDQ